MFAAYLVVVLSSLLLLPSSLAEHAGKMKHKHHPRHDLAALEPRHIPAAFDGVQWDDDTRHSFQSANKHELRDTNEPEVVTEVVQVTTFVVWRTVWVHPQASTTLGAISDAPVSSEHENSTTVTPTAMTSFSVASTNFTETASMNSTTKHHSHKHSHSSSETSALLSSSSSILEKTTSSSSTSTTTSTASVSAKISSTSTVVVAKSTTTTHSLSTKSSVASSVSHHSSSSSKASITKSAASTTYPVSALTPTATFSLIHGAAKNVPSTQYIDCAANAASLPKLAANMLTSLDNPEFQSSSPIFNGSGTLTLTSALEADLADLKVVPFMNRDGGHGGVINGHKIFYFADTATYTQPTAEEDGTWTGFVSNSIAFDVGNNAFDGKALTLRDPEGAFINNMGTQRNFVPFTEDEAAWSLGNGWAKRYAVWPWGSLVPLTLETSLLYAPIVIQDNSADPQFRSGGVTLVTISMTDDGQPIVERPVPGLFPAADTQYGVYGGIRSWGPSGVGGTDGKVYVMGTHNNGLLLARTDASTVEDLDSYEYWDNSNSSPTWSSTPDLTSFFMHGAYSSGNIFYSPLHGTFLSVGQNPYTDSKFYYQYLMVPFFIEPWQTGADYVDIVEYITQYQWSDTILLFDMPVLATGHYTYDGGVHVGYFDDQDITNGGDRMLLAWTAPTGQAAGSVAGGYQIWTAEVRWA